MINGWRETRSGVCEAEDKEAGYSSSRLKARA
jgi:hypothetical protein